MPQAALTIAITGLAATAGAFLCVFPGIFLAVALALSVPAVYCEKLNGIAAIARSWELVLRRGPGGLTGETNWVRVVVIGFVTLVVVYVLYAIASLPVLAAQGIGQGSGMVPVNTALGPQILPLSLLVPLQLVGAVIQGVFFPIWMIPWPLLYYDIRIRHEGLDLELTLRKMAAEDAPAGAVVP
jgi:hypothetical protein